MKKMVITVMVIFAIFFCVSMGVLYVKANAFQDVNAYMCDMQKSWNLGAHVHFTDTEGNKYACTK